MVKPRTLILAMLALITLAVAAAAERGTDGELRMLYWQAPSILNPTCRAAPRISTRRR